MADCAALPGPDCPRGSRGYTGQLRRGGDTAQVSRSLEHYGRHFSTTHGSFPVVVAHGGSHSTQPSAGRTRDLRLVFSRAAGVRRCDGVRAEWRLDLAVYRNIACGAAEERQAPQPADTSLKDPAPLHGRCLAIHPSVHVGLPIGSVFRDRASGRLRRPYEFLGWGASDFRMDGSKCLSLLGTARRTMENRRSDDQTNIPTSKHTSQYAPSLLCEARTDSLGCKGESERPPIPRSLSSRRDRP